MADGPLIEAAGGLLWRPAARGIEIAVVHRPKYDDWSLPKGKLEPGEHPFAGALREVQEETGSTAVLGRQLGEVRYRASGTPKRVRYWAMRRLDGEFTPGDEVDVLEWLPPRAARRRLTFPPDGLVLRRYVDDARPAWPLVLLRHASAGSRSAWTGEDAERPLDKLGRRQAEALPPLLSAYGVEHAISANVVRCQETVAPFVTAAGLRLDDESLFSEDGYRANPEAAAECLLDIASTGQPTVVGSQGKAIPGLVRAVCAALDADAPADPAVRKGGLWVFHLARGADRRPDLVALDAVEPLVEKAG